MSPVRLSRIFLAMSAVLVLTQTIQARCGVERWSIKTGTDSDAAQIDLTTPSPTSVGNLIGFSAPHPIPKTSRVPGPETTLWTVTATLTAFKIEDDPNTGDSDYHLVLMDPSGSTMIAEIPSPDCVASGSAFTTGITNARQQFDARFTPVGQFQDVSVPVRVTGVGMFDFAHGQRGRSDNGIELHPVLDIAFLDTSTVPPTPLPPTPTSTPTPTPGPATQLIGNPSFENGATNPAPWTASPGVIDNSTGEPAHTGKANLSAVARKYLSTLSTEGADDHPDLSRAMWLHALAIIYSPLYLSENASGIRRDWPRIPFPDTLEQLQQSALLGAALGKLLDVEQSPAGVTSGKLRKELAILGRITGSPGMSLSITAGWGHLQKEDIVMPGSGLAKKRQFTEDEKQAIAEGALELDISLDIALSTWSGTAIDVYLNNESHWATVPLAAWEYTIGGYLVLKKWLSYREETVIGREITKDEAREFTHMVRRIAAMLLMEPVLDENYLAVKSASYAWPQPEAEEQTLVFDVED